MARADPPVATMTVDEALVLALHWLVASSGWLTTAVVGVAQWGVFVLPLALAGVWLRANRPDDRRREAVLVGIVAAVLGFALGLLLERTLNRPRPFAELGFDPLVLHATDSSFPSDHTLVGVAFVGPLLWRAPKLGGLLFAWALTVGAARVACGLHYPSDILGSAVLALGLDGVVWLATGPIRSGIRLHGSSPGLIARPPGGGAR